MRQSVGLYQRGFSVLELILAVTLILAMAAVVVPGPVPAPRVTEDQLAQQETGAIAEALTEFRQDTGCEPVGRPGRAHYTWLRGPGQDPEFASHPGGVAGEVGWFLIADKMEIGERWGGPYLDDLNSDPWGRRYVVVLARRGAGDSRKSAERTWVLSAGPNGVIETSPRDPHPRGDDVGSIVF